jgi:hypothetical protein
VPSGRNKHQSRENRKHVRAVLMKHWDPIGVADNPNASDEYDAYRDKAYVMLMDERASADDIATYLLDIAANYMGLGDQPRLRVSSERTAEILVSLRPTFESH